MKLHDYVVQANPHNYDAWFDYLRLSEDGGDLETTREVYERAISNIPLVKEKRHWRRYIYLWINYALYEELEAKVCTYLYWFVNMPQLVILPIFRRLKRSTDQNPEH